MSDGFVYTEYGRYFEQEEEKKKASDKKFKILKILVLVLSLVLMLNVVLYAVVFPCFSPARVVFSGLEHISDSEILKKSGMDCSVTWASFDKKEFESRLASNPVLDAESIKVEKKFPDQILVHASERVPVAVSLMNIDGRTRAVQIDKNGVVFSNNNFAFSDQVPLITGLELDKVTEGFRISPTYRSLLERIVAIDEIEPDYFSEFSEIHVRQLSSGSYELVLYPIYKRIRVITDKSFGDESLRGMSIVINLMHSIESGVDEIDARYGVISYKKDGKEVVLQGVDVE